MTQSSSSSKKSEAALSPSTGRPSALLAPPELSLAKGGGSLKGAEEKFQANPVTGSAGISIPVPLSPGRGGAGPKLALTYDSGSGNGPFGLGWSLDLFSIVRQTSRRLPLYDDLAESDTFVLSGVEDLIYTENLGIIDGHQVRRYQPRIEGSFARIEKWVPQNGVTHWRVYSPDGSLIVFGQSSNSRIADPDHPEKVFRWLPSRSVDAVGNVVCYRYLEDGAQRYLQQVFYGNMVPGTLSENASDYHFHVQLLYQDRVDSFLDRRAGFTIPTTVRCHQVQMLHFFQELGASPTLVRSLNLQYTNGQSNISLLAKSIQRGHKKLANGTEETLELPPQEFEYQSHAWNSAWKDMPSDAIEDVIGGAANTQWMDLWGEGLQGILSERGDNWWYKRNLGGGHFAPALAVSPKPKPGSASGLLDLEGDGHLWLVQHSGAAAGSVRLDEEGNWGQRAPFRQIPRIDFESPRVRFLDIDGDGRADVLVDEGDRLVWYPSEGEEGYGAPQERLRNIDADSPQLVARGKSEAIFLADMSGDGLADIVRVRNAELCYWPNLGHGRFAEKVTMRGLTPITNPEEFNPAFLRLADLDGSGPADLIYLGNGKIEIWLNQCGYAFVEKKELSLPQTAGARLDVVDLLGNGTACVVWMSPLPAHAQKPARYLDLMAGKKPHIMKTYRNNMGKQIRLEYTPSTAFYLKDREKGEPWATRLPYVVQCLTSVETKDLITGWSHTAKYEYHHGCHDSKEGEFRGFGRVDRIDAEKGLDTKSDQDPVLTRTWFHLGVAPDKKWLPEFFAKEYWKGDAAFVPERLEPQFPVGLTPQEWLEAHRAFKGRPLREEIYALDLSDKQDIPYATKDSTYRIQKIAQRAIAPERNHSACVWLVTDAESIARHFERNTTDPRIAHNLVLSADAYGRPLCSASVVYARQQQNGVPAKVWEEQSKRHIVMTEVTYAMNYEPALGSTDRVWRMGGTKSTCTWEMTGVAPSAVFYSAQDLLDAKTDAETNNRQLEFQETPNPLLASMRLVEKADVEFLNDSLNGPRTDASPGKLGLVYQSYSLSYTSGLLAENYGTGRITDAMLIEGGYTKRADGHWWIQSGKHVYPANAASHFYIPVGVLDPFGNQTTITLDSHDLLVASISDAIGNTVLSDNDYRTLAPWMITDPNGNRTAVETDALGIVVKSASMGKVGAGEGDTLADPTAKMSYSLTNFKTTGKPNWVRTYSREKHGATNPRWQEKVEYSDGLGNLAMVKIQAEPGWAKQWDAVQKKAVDVNTGTAIRWVGNGRTILNNKGNPVKQYEPYFSVTDAYESEAELVETGVTPVMHYDPLGRLMRTDLPDGTFSKVEFTPWMQKSFDPNDTVLDSLWYIERGSPDPAGAEPSDPERRAAWLAAKHAETPTITHLDSLGRAFYVITNDGAGQQAVTRSVLDIEGNVQALFDAKPRVDAQNRPIAVMETRYGIHGETCYTKSMDAGERWLLVSVDGNSLYSWDSRSHRMHSAFDDLRRPIKQLLSISGASETLIGCSEYGETAPNAQANNLRGKIWRVYDQSGLTENVAYDFKGNILQTKRQFTKEYKVSIDWGVSNRATLLEAEIFGTNMVFDALNRATSIQTPSSATIPASEVIPTYNEANFLETVDVKLRGAAAQTNFVADIDYDAKGQRERILYGNGATTKYTYDDKTYRLKRLRSTRTSGTDALQDLNYTYDPSGNITEIADDAQQILYFNGQAVAPSQKFEYDALYRLTKATGREHLSIGSGTEPEFEGQFVAQTSPENGAAMQRYLRTWQYDEVGNILAMIHNANSNSWNRSYVYATTSNRLASTTVGQTTLPYSHNAHGSMTKMPHLDSMDWDFAERLSHIKRSTTDAYYNYDGSGQRVRKVIEKNGLLETRLYLAGFEVFRRSLNGVPELERETLHIMDDKRRIAVVETKTRENSAQIANPVPVQRYQLDNHLGSASLELDEVANVISYEEYYPYGDTSYKAGRSASEVSEKRYRYTGKEKDEESGLYYHGARYYACWLGRWTASDPAGMVDGANLYMYVRGNPVRLSDPSGREGKEDWKASLSWGERAALWLDDKIQESPAARGVFNNLNKRGEALYAAPEAIVSTYREKGAGGLVKGVVEGVGQLATDTVKAAEDVGEGLGKVYYEGDSSAWEQVTSRSLDIVLNVADLVTVADGVGAAKNATVSGGKALVTHGKNAAKMLEGGSLATAEGVVLSGGGTLAATPSLLPIANDAAKGTIYMAAAAKSPSEGSAVGDGVSNIEPQASKTPAKRGPKPHGTGPHNQKIAEVAAQVKDGEIIAGGQTGLPEILIETPGGVKTGRRPDILVRRADGSTYGINVGKTNASGAPITREAQALNDLEQFAGLEMHFVPYK